MYATMSPTLLARGSCMGVGTGSDGIVEVVVLSPGEIVDIVMVVVVVRLGSLLMRSFRVEELGKVRLREYSVSGVGVISIH